MHATFQSWNCVVSQLFKILVIRFYRKLTCSFSLNTDFCIDQYIFASAIYLISVILQCYPAIIYLGISTSGYGKEVVDVINSIETQCIYINEFLMFNNQDQRHMVYRFDYILSQKKNYVWLKNSKNICLRSIINME